jgi:tetratricopeptide (TPR) repeat protein
MGWIYYRMGKFDKARDYLVESAGLAGDPTVWDHLGDVENAAGRIESALTAWDESLRLDSADKKVRAKALRAYRALPAETRASFSQVRAAFYFDGIHAIHGLLKATVKVDQGKASVNAQFSYDKGGEMRAEMPGPLGAPLFLLTKQAEKPSTLGALSTELDPMQPLICETFDRLWDLLSANAFKDKAAHATFDERSGALSSISWAEGTLTLSAYDPTNFYRLPETITWQNAVSKQSLQLRWVKPAVEILSSPKP